MTTINGTCYDLDGAVTKRYLFYAEVKTGAQNVDENYTEVTVALKVCRNPEYAYANSAYNLTDSVTVNLSIDGSEVYSTKSSDIDTRNGKVWTFATKAKNVNHKADGTKTVAITASFSGADVSSLDKGMLSGEVELKIIPRASTITAAEDVTLGQACMVKWTPASSSFRYKLEFSLGDWKHTTGVIYPKQTAAYTYTGYTLPVNVTEQIGGTKTAIMTVKLYTYSDSGATTQVGSAGTATFTVTVPSNNYTMPTAKMALSPVHDLPEAFAGLYIQGKSKVKAAITATAKYGASIEEYSMQVDGVTYTGGEELTSDYLGSYGKLTVTAYAEDDRGITGGAKGQITVIAYNKPKILPATGEEDVIAARCDADGNFSDSGTCLKIKAKCSYSPVESGGVQKNFCRIRYRYKADGGSYGNWITILAEDADSNEVETGALLGGALSVKASYLVQVQAIDDIGEYTNTTITVPTERVYWHRDGRRRSFCFGGYVEEDNTFAIAEDITFRSKGPIQAEGGGNIDCLTLGTRLTATEGAILSLNNQKTPGNYYSPNAENSQYITDSPYTTGGFGLTVRQMQTTGYIRQELFYGRTTWIRHFDGSAWSEWWRYQTTTVPETASADYVIETGTEDGWTYKKFKGGTYEAFGTFEVTPSEATLNGSLYRSNNMTIELPFKISSAYVAGTAVGFYWITNGGKSGDSAITLRIMSDKTLSTTSAIEVRLMVMGTYS